jgi:hypothetical protein
MHAFLMSQVVSVFNIQSPKSSPETTITMYLTSENDFKIDEDETDVNFINEDRILGDIQTPCPGCYKDAIHIGISSTYVL